MLPNVLTPDRRPGGGALLGALVAAGAVIALSVLALLSIGGSAPADAATGQCAGSLIESRNLRVGGHKVGELDVYYDRRTGKNCARMNHAGRTWGKRLKTRVWIGICSEKRPGGNVCHYNPRTDAVDVGRYRYYAGPATTKVSARGRCIAASGYLWMNGRRHVVTTQPWVGHCGS